MDEYSIWKPATISSSASGKSNGVLFVSASAEIKKMKEHWVIRPVKEITVEIQTLRLFVQAQYPSS